MYIFAARTEGIEKCLKKLKVKEIFLIVFFFIFIFSLFFFWGTLLERPLFLLFFVFFLIIHYKKTSLQQASNTQVLLSLDSKFNQVIHEYFQ